MHAPRIYKETSDFSMPAARNASQTAAWLCKEGEIKIEENFRVNVDLRDEQTTDVH
jgi:hypothetical protein